MAWKKIDIQSLDDLDPQKRYRLGPWELKYFEYRSAWETDCLYENRVAELLGSGCPVFEWVEPLVWEGRGYAYLEKYLNVEVMEAPLVFEGKRVKVRLEVIEDDAPSGTTSAQSDESHQETSEAPVSQRDISGVNQDAILDALKDWLKKPYTDEEKSFAYTACAAIPAMYGDEIRAQHWHGGYMAGYRQAQVDAMSAQRNDQEATVCACEVSEAEGQPERMSGRRARKPTAVRRFKTNCYGVASALVYAEAERHYVVIDAEEYDKWRSE